MEEEGRDKGRLREISTIGREEGKKTDPSSGVQGVPHWQTALKYPL